MLGSLLSPFVSDVWVGRTYVHALHDRNDPPSRSALDLREISANDAVAIATSLHDLRRAPDHREGIRRFGAWEGDRLVSLCTFWFGEGYQGFYHLATNEAELADIVTAESSRGQGRATALIQYGTSEMHAAGFTTLYAKVWHSNKPSMRAFVKANWQQQNFFVRLQPRATTRRLWVEWRSR